MNISKRGNKWTALVYYKDADGNGRRKRFTADKKKDAELMAAAFLNSQKESSSDFYDITFQEAIERYIKGREDVLSPSTLREYRRQLERFPVHFRKEKIHDITREKVQILINEYARELSARTVRNIHGFICAVMKEYRSDFVLNTRLPRCDPKQSYIPTDDEVKRLVDHVKDTPMEAPVLLAAFGGMRRSEICALTINDIGDGFVSITKAMVMDSNRSWVIKAPKTVSGYRQTPLSKTITDRIKQIAAGESIVDINPDELTHRFEHVLKGAFLPHFRFHALRSYYASSMHQIGVAEVYLQHFGGWNDVNTMRRSYIKPKDDKVQQMADLGIEYFEKLIQN